MKITGGKTLIYNDMFGIEATYEWNQTSETKDFFLYPYMDDNKKTIAYFAFDTHEKKTVF